MKLSNEGAIRDSLLRSKIQNSCKVENHEIDLYLTNNLEILNLQSSLLLFYFFKVKEFEIALLNKSVSSFNKCLKL